MSATPKSKKPWNYNAKSLSRGVISNSGSSCSPAPKAAEKVKGVYAKPSQKLPDFSKQRQRDDRPLSQSESSSSGRLLQDMMVNRVDSDSALQSARSNIVIKERLDSESFCSDSSEYQQPQYKTIKISPAFTQTLRPSSPAKTRRIVDPLSASLPLPISKMQVCQQQHSTPLQSMFYYNTLTPSAIYNSSEKPVRDTDVDVSPSPAAVSKDSGKGSSCGDTDSQGCRHASCRRRNSGSSSKKTDFQSTYLRGIINNLRTVLQNNSAAHVHLIDSLETSVKDSYARLQTDCETVVASLKAENSLLRRRLSVVKENKKPEVLTNLDLETKARCAELEAALEKSRAETQAHLLALCSRETELVEQRHSALERESRLRSVISRNSELTTALEVRVLALEKENRSLGVQLQQRECELARCQDKVRLIQKNLTSFVRESCENQEHPPPESSTSLMRMLSFLQDGSRSSSPALTEANLRAFSYKGSPSPPVSVIQECIDHDTRSEDCSVTSVSEQMASTLRTKDSHCSCSCTSTLRLQQSALSSLHPTDDMEFRDGLARIDEQINRLQHALCSKT